MPAPGKSEVITHSTGYMPTMGVGLIRTGDHVAILLKGGLANLVALGGELPWKPSWRDHVAA